MVEGRVKAGATVTFTPRLQDSKILRTALSVVVAVAAIVFAGPIAGALGVAGVLGVTAATATALVGAGIMLAGTLALNALFPVRPPGAVTSEAPGSLNSIQGARNQSSPFGAIPIVLGRHRQSPFYAAQPYTETVGDDQFLRMFCWGYGPISVSEMKIGETPLSSFSDIQIEHREGYASDAPTTLYPGQVDEQAFDIKLESVDGWHIRTTGEEIDEFSVDVVAPQGIYHVNSENGELEGYVVLVDVQYSVAGATTSTEFVDFLTRCSDANSPRRASDGGL